MALCLFLCDLPHSPGHHLLLLVGGVASAADWVDGCGQEVYLVVLKVLIHQRQDDLRKKWHKYTEELLLGCVQNRKPTY